MANEAFPCDFVRSVSILHTYVFEKKQLTNRKVVSAFIIEVIFFKPI